MQPAPSAPSSVDGYDSFENTNNKKKRKIPSAGDSVLNSAHGLNIDMSSHPTSAGAGSPSGEVNGDHSLYSSAGYTTTGSFGSNGQEHEGSSGIIRNAIANAGKLPPQGEENVSLLQQHSAKSKGTPSSSQFTFTCDSQVTGTLHWPANSSRHNMGQQSSFINGAPAAHHEDLNKAANRERRKTRRQIEKELVRAAEDRRQAAARRYYQNPPKPEDFWICEFCEYEAIFGEPPRALIRQYELKDYKKRQEEADRKRLLEKAKQKGRKGKKNGKSSSRGSMANQHDTAGAYETNVPPRNQSGNSQSTQSEDDEDVQNAELEQTYHTPQPSRRPGNEEDRGGGPSRRRGQSVDSGGAGIPRAPTIELAVP
ncbi:unnamed protein product, partial [Clonostachys chloroleuca]